MNQYELHTHNDPELPVIFHYDIMKKNDGYFGVHWHDGPEILYCTHGKGEIIIDSEAYHMEVGDTVIINSGCFHTIKCLSDENLRYYCLIPSESLCEDFGFNNFSTITPRIHDEDLKNSFKTINSEYERKLPYYKTKIKSEILNMFVLLQRKYSSDTDIIKISDSKKQMVKDAVKYIKNNYGNHITVEDIAANSGFSRYYFCHSFKEITGISVVNYINTVRCENAKTYIRSKKHTISEIALMCGFDNMSYFTKTYKKHMGALPSEDLKIR